MCIICCRGWGSLMAGPPGNISRSRFLQLSGTSVYGRSCCHRLPSPVTVWMGSITGGTAHEFTVWMGGICRTDGEICCSRCAGMRAGWACVGGRIVFQGQKGRNEWSRRHVHHITRQPRNIHDRSRTNAFRSHSLFSRSHSQQTRQFRTGPQQQVTHKGNTNLQRQS